MFFFVYRGVLFIVTNQMNLKKIYKVDWTLNKMLINHRMAEKFYSYLSDKRLQRTQETKY